MQDRIEPFIDADIPVLLWGPPGVGKTAMLRAIANRRGAHVETLIGSTIDPVDVGGQPVARREKVIIAPPRWAERAADMLRSRRPVWLFLDEVSCAPPAVQAAFLRVVHERAVADLDLRGMRVVAAANPPESAADGGWISPAMANRWAHVAIGVDADAWTRGELSGWGSPHNAKTAPWAAKICAFIRRNPSALLRIPKSGEAASSGAWPSPRSWSAAIRAIAAHGDAAIAVHLVGDAATGEFAEWIVKLDLPDPESILARTATLPERGDQLQATLDGVIAAVLVEHADRKNRIDAAWAILDLIRPDSALRAASVLADATGTFPDTAIKLGRAMLRAETAVNAKVSQ